MGGEISMVDAARLAYGESWMREAVLNHIEIPAVKKGGAWVCPKCSVKLSICGKPYCAWCGQKVRLPEDD